MPVSESAPTSMNPASATKKQCDKDLSEWVQGSWWHCAQWSCADPGRYSDSQQWDAEVTCQCIKHLLKHPQVALGYLDVTPLTSGGAVMDRGAKQTLGRGTQCPSRHLLCGSGRYCWCCETYHRKWQRS